MAKKTKIVMVGGGSYGWAPKIISDMMHEPALAGSEVTLLDINPTAAKEVKGAVEKMASTLGADFSFKVTDSQDEAFKGADYVVITISTGGFDSMRFDLKIPEKYGIFQTVGDTVGAGGWSRSLRNIPVFTDMARKIEKLSPRAVIMNYTNPMATLTGAIYATSSLRTVGLCHGVFAAYNLIQKIFNVKEEDIAVSYAGVNHFFWILDFTVKGEPGYPLLAKKLKNKTIDEYFAEVYKDEAGMLSHKHELCDMLYREFGLIPYPGDRHTCEFMSGYLNNGEKALKRFGLVRTTIEERIKGAKDRRKYVAELASGKRAPYERSRETAVDIMKSYVSGKPFIDVVNMPNQGQVANLPAGSVVETMGLVDARGFTPLAAGKIPAKIQPMLEAHCKVQMMTLDAALKGDREAAISALRLDPQCSHLSPGDVRAMGNELIKATKAWLPQF